MERSFLKVLAAVVGVAAGLGGVAGGGRAWGEQVTYYVDPGRSSLTLSGTGPYGLPLAPGAGDDGLIVSYSGTINASRDLIANTLQLTGGIVAAQNGNVTSPVTGQPANYNFTYFGGAGSNEFAVRGFSFSVTSPEIDSPSTFDVSQLSAVIQTGELDYKYSLGGGRVSSVPISGNLAFTSASATLRPTGEIETLTLPVDTDFSVVIYPSGQPMTLPMHLSGTLIALSPEPGTLVLLFLPAMFLMRRGYVRPR